MDIIEPMPVYWWPNSGYNWRVKDPHVTSTGVVTQQVWDWCSVTFGSMGEHGWCDQGAYICFKHQDHAAIFCMTWY